MSMGVSNKYRHCLVIILLVMVLDCLLLLHCSGHDDLHKLAFPEFPRTVLKVMVSVGWLQSGLSISFNLSGDFFEVDWVA